MQNLGRRSNQVRGFVDFPISDPRYKNTGEGGMFVILVVVPHHAEGNPLEDWDTFYARMKTEEWKVCSGGSISVNYDESLIGDDKVDCKAGVAFPFAHPAEDFHFPSFKERTTEAGEINYDAYVSREYLSAILLGSTGWSGWNIEKEENFLCTFEDLTEDGKALYKLIEKLYEGKGTLHLQTWLDT